MYLIPLTCLLVHGSVPSTHQKEISLNAALSERATGTEQSASLASVDVDHTVEKKEPPKGGIQHAEWESVSLAQTEAEEGRYRNHKPGTPLAGYLGEGTGHIQDYVSSKPWFLQSEVQHVNYDASEEAAGELAQVEMNRLLQDYYWVNTRDVVMCKENLKTKAEGRKDVCFDVVFDYTPKHKEMVDDNGQHIPFKHGRDARRFVYEENKEGWELTTIGGRYSGCRQFDCHENPTLSALGISPVSAEAKAPMEFFTPPKGLQQALHMQPSLGEKEASLAEVADERPPGYEGVTTGCEGVSYEDLDTDPCLNQKEFPGQQERPALETGVGDSGTARRRRANMAITVYYAPDSIYYGEGEEPVYDDDKAFSTIDVIVDSAYDYMTTEMLHQFKEGIGYDDMIAQVKLLPGYAEQAEFAFGASLLIIVMSIVA